jgi:hypothetical protein
MLQAESGTDPGVDFEVMRERVEIGRALHTGDVQKAIDMVNDLDPEVGLLYEGAYPLATACMNRHMSRVGLG